MTIPEIAKKYNCNKSALYQKFKRRKTELEGHYFIEDGVTYIHNDAVHLLLPEEVIKTDYSEKLKQTSERNEDLSKRELELKQKIKSLEEENLKLTVEYVEEMGECCKAKCSDFISEEKIKLLTEDRDYYEKMLDELNAKIAELQNLLSEKGRSGILSVFAKR